LHDVIGGPVGVGLGDAGDGVADGSGVDVGRSELGADVIPAADGCATEVPSSPEHAVNPAGTRHVTIRTASVRDGRPRRRAHTTDGTLAGRSTAAV
jgi:hypothetical protein